MGFYEQKLEALREMYVKYGCQTCPDCIDPIECDFLTRQILEVEDYIMTTDPSVRNGGD